MSKRFHPMKHPLDIATVPVMAKWRGIFSARFRCSAITGRQSRKSCFSYLLLPFFSALLGQKAVYFGGRQIYQQGLGFNIISNHRLSDRNQEKSFTHHLVIALIRSVMALIRKAAVSSLSKPYLMPPLRHWPDYPPQ